MPDYHDKRAHDRIDRLEARHMELEKSIAENTNMTREIADNTKELVELFKGAKGLRALVLFIAPAIAAVYAIIQYIKGHS